MAEPASQWLRIVQIAPRAEQTKAFVLRHPHGARLPGYTPGAHVRVKLPLAAGAAWRAYSLVRPADAHGADSYEICVRRDAAGAGGSAYMHALAAGALLEVSTPANAFELDPEATAYRLVAGGIGITPLLCMARALTAQGRAVSLCYLARSEAAMAYLDELRSLPGLKLQVQATGDAAQARKAVERALANPGPGERAYLCGPSGLMAAAAEIAEQHGWPGHHVRREAFTQAPVDAGAFRVALRRSGRRFDVGARESLLDALIAQLGPEVAHGCRTGVCGACLVPVLAGPVDHRDSFLTDEDRAEGTLMCACVSRAPAGALLELDL